MLSGRDWRQLQLRTGRPGMGADPTGVGAALDGETGMGAVRIGVDADPAGMCAVGPGR